VEGAYSSPAETLCERQKVIESQLSVGIIYNLDIVSIFSGPSSVDGQHPMAQLLLNQILSQLQALERQELQQLTEAIQLQLGPAHTAANPIAFREALLASGLVRQLKTRTATKSITDRQPIQVQGKAVSQSIIEERR
jgi:hypothetical protein